MRPSSSTILLMFVPVAAAWALATGCPGSLDDPDRFLDPCPEGQVCTSTVPPQETVFRPQCGGAGCHAPPNAPEGLDLVSDGLADRLVNVISPNPSCGGGVYVVPGNPAQSLLFQKLTGAAPCGSPMPPLAELAPEDLAAVQAWIVALGRVR